MTILEEIIDGASGAVPVSTLLRRLRVVASRTDTGKLDKWVTSELDGYDDPGSLPSYRGPFGVPVLGDFFGAFGSGVRNVGIPPTTFPEKLREGSLFNLSLMNSVAQIEEMATHDSVNLAWPADAVRYYNYALGRGEVQPIVREDMALGSASRPVPRQVFVGVLDAVRNRVLELALEIEKVAPDAGQQTASASEKADVANVVNNFTFNAAANVAIDSTNVTQTVALPGEGDEQSLLRYLGALGVEPRQVVELEAALEGDRQENHKGQGPKVTAWLGKVTTAVTTGVASTAILAALKAYYGI